MFCINFNGLKSPKNFLESGLDYGVTSVLGGQNLKRLLSLEENKLRNLAIILTIFNKNKALDKGIFNYILNHADKLCAEIPPSDVIKRVRQEVRSKAEKPWIKMFSIFNGKSSKQTHNPQLSAENKEEKKTDAKTQEI